MALAWQRDDYLMADFRSDSTVDRATRTNTLIPAPVGIQDGDDLVILFETAALGGPPVPSPPAGFLPLVGYPATVTDGAFISRVYGWERPAAGESGDYQVTHANAISQAYMVAVSDPDPVDPIDPDPTANSGSGADSTALGFGAVDLVDLSFVIWWADAWNAGTMGIPSAPPVFTSRYDPPAGVLHVATGQVSPAGPVGHKVVAMPGDPSPWGAGLIAIKGQSSPPVVPSDAAFARGDGSGV